MNERPIRPGFAPKRTGGFPLRLCENVLICYACRRHLETSDDRCIEGCDRRELLFLPPCVDDYVAEDSTARIVDVIVDEL